MDFRANLPREKYFNFWPGKMPFVHQLWEGMGERGEEAEGGDSDGIRRAVIWPLGTMLSAPHTLSI